MAKKVEVFTAGTFLCQDALRRVRLVAFPGVRVVEYNLLELEEDDPGYRKAIEYGISSVPTIVVDGKIAPFCVREPITEGNLRRVQVDRPG
ncbi:MAG TPA: glutaredoxin [Armatimonadota bacterium]|jgi:hypothetical protein